MNVADMDDLRARLNAHGGSEVNDLAQAELVLVNTCTVRAKAHNKAHSFFGTLKRLKKGSTQNPTLVAMGCVVNHAHAELKARFPHLDLLLDFSSPDEAFDALCEHFHPLRNTAVRDDYAPYLDTMSSHQRFVTAIRGCQHGCSFCIVPRARGPQLDVPLARIIAEAQRLQDAGAPDLTVLGQNILAYGTTSGDRRPRFVELMQALLQETDFPWITFLTSLPADLTEEICERVIGQPRITPLLHLPVQSGSDRVLADMNRGHDVAHYRRVVAKARECRADLFLTTDLLVGFPTEREQDFRATLALAEEVGFNDAFMYAYSERQHTIAARKFEDAIPRAEKRERLNELIGRQRVWATSRNRSYLGQTLTVIIEYAGPDGVTARTAFNKPVLLGGARAPVGAYTKAEITGVKVSSFLGKEVV